MSNNNHDMLQAIAAVEGDILEQFQIEHDNAVDRLTQYMLNKYFHGNLSNEAKQQLERCVTRDFERYIATLTLYNYNNWINILIFILI